MAAPRCWTEEGWLTEAQLFADLEEPSCVVCACACCIYAARGDEGDGEEEKPGHELEMREERERENINIGANRVETRERLWCFAPRG